MEKLYFEDINVGDAFTGAKVLVEPETMIVFAKEYDNQPMHTDPAAARAMGLEGVIASGAYTFALGTKSTSAIWEQLHFLPSGLGFQMSFVRPALGGDELQAHVEIISKRESRDPSRGVLGIKSTLRNQQGVSVLDIENVWLLRTKKENQS